MTCLYTFILLCRYVSDFAYNGYKPVCQHKLILAIQKSQQGSETARTFPPCLLEWTASRERANMALDIYCFDGMKRERIYNIIMHFNNNCGYVIMKNYRSTCAIRLHIVLLYTKDLIC